MNQNILDLIEELKRILHRSCSASNQRQITEFIKRLKVAVYLMRTILLLSKELFAMLEVRYQTPIKTEQWNKQSHATGCSFSHPCEL